jgi:hypothetical protein
VERLEDISNCCGGRKCLKEESNVEGNHGDELKQLQQYNTTSKDYKEVYNE